MGDPLRRFLASMDVNAGNWRDGPDPDLAAIDAMTPEQKREAERFLLARGIRNSAEIDALARLDTPRAREALLAARRSPDLVLRLCAQDVGPPDVAGRERAILDGLREGQRLAFLMAAKSPTPAVREALLGVVDAAQRDLSYDAAALLLHLHGDLPSLDDDRAERGFLQRFLRADSPARREAVEELRGRLQSGGGPRTLGGMATVDSLYALETKTLEGKPAPLSAYLGKVALVVNVASECGYTPQYAGLEQLYGELKDKGFVVLGFPSNDFGGQEPGSPEEIRAFCSTKFKVSFPLFEKVVTKAGPGQSPIYALFAKAVDRLPQWNFAKYLVAKDGRVLKAYVSDVKPDSPALRKDIEAALA